MKTNKWHILLVISFIVIGGCQSVSVPFTPTPIVFIPTSTIQPTNTPQPTNTSIPTNTPVTPTATVPPPDILTKYLENVRVVKVDSFDNDSNWSPNSTTVISNGTMEIVGEGGNSWSATAAYKKNFHEGEGFVISFKFAPGTYFNMFLENGDWGTPPYKRFGMDINKGHVLSNLFVGKDSLGFTSLPGNFYPSSNTQYSFFMVSGQDGNFLALLWDPSNPEKTVKYKDKLENWKGLDWSFRTQTNVGTVIFENFMEVEFDGIK